ncbi:WASH complex subunit 3 [Malaya genurostris]|uniref:WASH complex subunit 3 n=1 Tax=Malaya genurostris TaxID=325434 RepID=UPI0026F3F16B|nr:WASH complex subunit 3 [Malaya genurostris]
METVGLDKRELPPTNQKRMVAFINHFILNTVSFLNKFASDCEDKFIDYEHKIQSLEASLLIVEAKIASIDALNSGVNVTNNETESTLKAEITEDIPVDPLQESISEEVETVRDARYDKYFKMIQVGVPVMAVKNKIRSEGLDPNYIDNHL